MLSLACRRFRARFSPGSAHPHRRACPECESFATALESAAGVRLPLPESLRKDLRAIAGPEPGSVLPFAVPRVPVPETLAGRLRGIAPTARPAPPEWLLNPRYAVAASALLALLLGPFFADAAHQGLRTLDTVHSEVSPLLRRTEESGSAEVEKLRSAAITACGAARRTVETSMGRLDEGLSGFSSRLYEAVSTDPSNQDPRHDPAGSVRRSK
jgi:hypothetical protein